MKVGNSKVVLKRSIACPSTVDLCIDDYTVGYVDQDPAGNKKLTIFEGWLKRTGFDLRVISRTPVGYVEFKYVSST